NGPSPFLEDLRRSVDSLRQREKAFLVKQPSWKHKLAELDLTIDMCLHRLSSSTLQSRILTCAVSELQRSWRTADAIIDYAEVYEPRMLAMEDLKDALGVVEDQSMIASRLGAYVWNDKEALLLFRAKLPVYYIRQYNEFDQQKIFGTSSFYNLCINVAAASPSYPVIYRGQAGADAKFSAIRVTSITLFDTASPFSNLHLENAYQSSYSVGSGSIISPTVSQPSTSAPSTGPVRTHDGPSKNSRRNPKKGKARSRGGGAACVPAGELEAGEIGTLSHYSRNDLLTLYTGTQVTHDLFADLPTENVFVTPPIRAWKEAGLSINRNHPAKREMLPNNHPRLKTVLPDPALVLGSTDAGRQRQYLAQWAHICELFMTHSRTTGGGEVPVPLRSAIWRKVLSTPFHGLYVQENENAKKKKGA
ncbi:hypothetical protein PQX77_013593, partial [Marasmius sp. AFHP31]